MAGWPTADALSVRSKTRLAALLVCAALSGPATATAAHPASRICGSYHSADDAYARIFARAAETAAETLATEYNGSYARVSPWRLRVIEPVIPITARQARREHDRAYLLKAAGTQTSYQVTARGFDGDTYAIKRNTDGSFHRTANVCGRTLEW
jgi:hypothetical protein